MELPGAVVVNEDVEGQHVPDGIHGVTIREKRRHGGVVHHEDRDSEAAVDLGREVSLGEVAVEGGEFGEFGEDSGYVVGVGGGGEGEGEEEDEGKGEEES